MWFNIGHQAGRKQYMEIKICMSSSCLIYRNYFFSNNIYFVSVYCHIVCLFTCSLSLIKYIHNNAYIVLDHSYIFSIIFHISLSNHCSAFAPVHSGVPQGSVLGPMIFTMYIKPLSAIIDSHSIIHHSFADDLQLQLSAPSYRISELLHSMQSCICDVKAWVTANMLKLNGNKTELMLVTSKRTKHLHNLPTSITIGNAQAPFKQSVKNLGLTLDCHLTMNAHVTNIARTCYFELRRLVSIRRLLTSTATATLVSAFVCQELTTVTHCCLALLMM